MLPAEVADHHLHVGIRQIGQGNTIIVRGTEKEPCLDMTVWPRALTITQDTALPGQGKGVDGALKKC